MPSVDRERFLEEGYLIVKEAVPRDELESVRKVYETLVVASRPAPDRYGSSAGLHRRHRRDGPTLCAVEHSLV
jgi:hypothetical protein